MEHTEETTSTKAHTKKRWQQPELKKIAVETTAGGSIESNAEHVNGDTTYKLS